jgi:hypothetical protein
MLLSKRFPAFPCSVKSKRDINLFIIVITHRKKENMSIISRDSYTGSLILI